MGDQLYGALISQVDIVSTKLRVTVSKLLLNLFAGSAVSEPCEQLT